MNSTVTGSQDPAPLRDSSREDVRLALTWLAWVLGLALLWYVVGFASLLVRQDLPGAPSGGTLALPLYPSGYGRLVVGALVASTVIGLIGRRASRIVPAGVLAAVMAWVATFAGLNSGPQARLYGNERLVLAGTVLFALAAGLGLGLGVWGARATWRQLVALSILVTVASAYVLGVILDLQGAFTATPSIGSAAAEIGRWLAVAALFGLSVAVAAMGRVAWLLLTAVSAVVLPLYVIVVTYLSQLIRPGIAGNVGERILAPIGDLVPAVLQTSSTWWPPLAVLAGGVAGLLVRQARRTQRDDMPVLEPANPVTTGDPGGRTPRRGDDDV